jgi:hypothetical protein
MKFSTGINDGIGFLRSGTAAVDLYNLDYRLLMG